MRQSRAVTSTFSLGSKMFDARSPCCGHRTATVELSWTSSIPAAVRSEPEDTPVNTLGIRRIMFAVDDIEGVLARLRAHGAELMGEITRGLRPVEPCPPNRPVTSVEMLDGSLAVGSRAIIRQPELPPRSSELPRSVPARASRGPPAFLASSSFMPITASRRRRRERGYAPAALRWTARWLHGQEDGGAQQPLSPDGGRGAQAIQRRGTSRPESAARPVERRSATRHDGGMRRPPTARTIAPASTRPCPRIGRAWSAPAATVQIPPRFTPRRDRGRRR
jgi:hypothetical protein